jgi:hypothetical protein
MLGKSKSDVLKENTKLLKARAVFRTSAQRREEFRGLGHVDKEIRHIYESG